MVRVMILAVHNHSALGFFLEKQFHLPVTLSVLAKDKLRAYSIMDFPFYDLKLYFPCMSSVVENSPGSTFHSIER